MSKTRDTGYLNNIIQYSSASVSFVSGSTTLFNINTSGSAKYGVNASSTHQFTGSVLITGSVGIGVTPYNNTIGPAFDMKNGVGMFGYGDAAYLSGNMYFDSAWKVKNAGTGSQITLAGEIIFNTSNPTGSAGAIVTNTERMRIANDGSVGIGVTYPNSQLYIGGQAAQTSSALLDSGTRAGLVSILVSGGAAGGGGGIVLGTNTQGNATGYGQIAIKSLLVNGAGQGTSDLAFSTRNATTDTALTERMRITSAGNVTINKAIETYAKLNVIPTNNQIYGGAAFYSTDGTETFLGIGNIGTAVGLEATYGATGAYVPMIFKTGGSTRMGITSGGNVGIGTSTANKQFVVNQGGTTGYFLSGWQSGTEIAYWYYDSSTIQFSSVSSSRALTFLTTDTERMRILGTGFVKISSTNSYAGTSNTAHSIISSTDNDNVLYLIHSNATNPFGPYLWFQNASPNNTTNYFIGCGDATQTKFYVYSNGNAVNRNGSYGTLSDIKLKENIVDATPKLDDILKLKVRNFNLIGFEEKQIGFIAQEFEEVFPKMVESTFDKDTNEEFKSIKTTVLVPMLVKAIQELKAENDTLKEILQRNNIQ